MRLESGSGEIRSLFQRFPVQNHKLAGGLFEDVQCLVDLGAGVFAGHDGADAGLAFGDGREGDSGGHDSGVEEGTRKIHSPAAVADDDGRDGRFAGRGGNAADVEAEAAEFGLEVAGVVPEALDALGLVFEKIEGRDAGGGDGRRMRGREEEGAGAMVEEVDEISRAADVAAQCADGLREGSDLDVDASVAMKMID